MESFVQGLAEDAAIDKANSFAETHFNNTNPYEDKHGHRRVLDRQLATKDEQKTWRRIQRQAWVHDKCFLGSCGVGLDCGLGLVPLATFFLPVLGPLAMYAVHARLVRIAEEELRVPARLEARLHANIVFDLLISLPPVVGAFLTWLHGCSTRNAGMLYVYMRQVAEERAGVGAAAAVPGAMAAGPAVPGTMAAGPAVPGAMAAGPAVPGAPSPPTAVPGARVAAPAPVYRTEQSGYMERVGRKKAKKISVGPQQSGVR